MPLASHVSTDEQQTPTEKSAHVQVPETDTQTVHSQGQHADKAVRPTNTCVQPEAAVKLHPNQVSDTDNRSNKHSKRIRFETKQFIEQF